MREVIYYERSHLQLDQMPCHILYSVDYAHPSGAYREISALCAFFYGTFADGYADHSHAFHSGNSENTAGKLEKNIPESLKKKGIEVTACKVHIEGELLKVCLWTKEVPDGELERGIKDELAANWGIREENCEVLAWENGKQTMGDSSPFGTSAYGNCTSGIR